MSKELPPVQERNKRKFFHQLITPMYFSYGLIASIFVLRRYAPWLISDRVTRRGNFPGLIVSFILSVIILACIIGLNDFFLRVGTDVNPETDSASVAALVAPPLVLVFSLGVIAYVGPDFLTQFREGRNLLSVARAAGPFVLWGIGLSVVIDPLVLTILRRVGIPVTERERERDEQRQ